MQIQISNLQARRFLLKKQLLLAPQSIRGKKAIENIFQSLRIIQYDPLNPCGRNPDLVLQARIKDYHPDGYQDWLYKERKGIECYDKELCIIPIEDFSLTDHRRILVKDREDQKRFLKKYQKAIEDLMLQIERDGEVSSSDIKDVTRVESGWGTEALFGRIALEGLWRMGRLVISRREKGKKYYDLPDRVHASLPITQDIRLNILTKEHIMRRIGSVGLLPMSGSGGGWQGLGGVSKFIKELVLSGELLEVKIKGIVRSYVADPQDVAFLERPISMPAKKLTFLAPLDNLMWDRQMILELFNFYYRWEVYTPLVKRKYGYYVLPILYGDEIIGRIEPVLTREKKLLIKGFWQEDEKRWDKTTWKAFKQGLEVFKDYLRATEIVGSPLK